MNPLAAKESGHVTLNPKFQPSVCGTFERKMSDSKSGEAQGTEVGLGFGFMLDSRNLKSRLQCRATGWECRFSLEQFMFGHVVSLCSTCSARCKDRGPSKMFSTYCSAFTKHV